MSTSAAKIPISICSLLVPKPTVAQSLHCQSSMRLVASALFPTRSCNVSQPFSNLFLHDSDLCLEPLNHYVVTRPNFPMPELFQKDIPNLSRPRMSTGSYTLKRRTCGSTRPRGWPLTLIKPLPCLQCATAVAVFFLPKHWTL